MDLDRKARTISISLESRAFLRWWFSDGHANRDSTRTMRARDLQARTGVLPRPAAREVARCA
ncbi:MAG: hypothetical protein U0610_19440 [bacterium]